MTISQYSHKLSNYTLVIKCETHLQQQAEQILQDLKKLQKQGKKLNHGVKHQIGGIVLTLCRQDSELVVCEPDFWGDPFNDIRDDITCSLTLQAKQNKLLSLINVRGVPTTFQQKIAVSWHSLKNTRLYLKREKPTCPDSSGWFINSSSPISTELYQNIFAYELLVRRPELMQVLSLPPGYLVVFQDDTIEAIVNEKKENIWTFAKTTISYELT